MSLPQQGDKTTADAPGTGTAEERLSFALDEDPSLQSEAEALREMLSAVRFTLVRRLGTGGMGVVWEAYDQKRGELIALKTMRRIDPATLVRFKHEFRAYSDISHTNLVNLYEMFAVKDRWFFTMELVEGSDFVTAVRSQPDQESKSSGASVVRVVPKATRESRPAQAAEPRLRYRDLWTRPGCASRSASSPKASRPSISRESSIGISSRPTS